jgi:hypothetical protein
MYALGASVLAASCSSGAGSPGAERTGTVGLAVSAPGGITVNEVSYVITGPTSESGTVDVSGANNAISFVVGGLAQGSGYTITLSATDTQGDLCTSVPISFDVSFQQTTQVATNLVCTVGDGGYTLADSGTGAVQVGATVTTAMNPTTTCPTISSFSVSPAEAVVGWPMSVSVSTLPGGAAVTYSTVATDDAGTGAATIVPSATGATLTCTAPGQLQLTATTTAPLALEAGSCPPQSISAFITCEPCTQTMCGGACVNVPPPGLGELVALKLSPMNANVTGAGSTPFQALAYYSNQPTTPVDVTSQAVWTASGSDLTVAGGTVSYSGTSIATGSVGATFGAVSASANVRVWNSTRLAQMTSLTVSSPLFGQPISEGACTQVTATAAYAGGTTEDVTATTIFTGQEPVLFGDLLVFSAPRSQYVTVDATLGTGLASTSLVFYIGDAALFTGTCTDRRIPGPAWKVNVSAPAGTLYVGQTVQLTANVNYADGSTRDVTGRTTWFSCDGSVLDVTQDGWVTALGTGSAQITAAFGNTAGQATFNVVAAPSRGNLTSLFVLPSGNNLPTGGSAFARALVTYDTQPGVLYNVTRDAAWSTSDPAVVTVPSSVTGPSVTPTAAGIGTAKVIASYGGWANAQTVRDWDPARLNQLTSLAIGVIGGSSSCAGGQGELIARFSDGTTEDVSASAQWQPLGDSGRGFISETGYLTPSGPYVGYSGIEGGVGPRIVAGTETSIWVAGPCSGPTCSDGIRNGFETGIDCGGTQCGPCGSGGSCLVTTDCQSNSCVQLSCQ